MVFQIPLFADLLSGAQHDQHDASAVRNLENGDTKGLCSDMCQRELF